MKILITNDDGIESEGLQALARGLAEAGNRVTVVAPDCNNSAVSHKLNMRTPMRLVDCSEGKNYRAYSLTGSPVDCVLFALYELNEAPELVLSGINDGNNLGTDCMYSGTVGGAQEGINCGIPSIALSTDYHCDAADFARVAQIVVGHLADWVKYAEETAGGLNVNIPAKRELKGTRFCKTARMQYFPQYECIDAEKGIFQYCKNATDRKPPVIEEGENDARLFDEGYITMTPLLLDMTDNALLKRWKR